VPFIWTKVPSSPPRQRRDEVREICRRRGARLCEDQIYYDEDGVAHALIEVSVHEAEKNALIEDLGAYDWIVLADADEKADRGGPPAAA